MSNIITKITTYNAPMEFNSADRFVVDVDTKLAKYKIEDFNTEDDLKKTAHSAFTTTEMVMTITGKRASYMRVEGSIFEGKPVSYWFLDKVTALQSESATTYSAKIDVFATFGEDMFNMIKNKEIKVSRMHEDRYIYDTATMTFKMNIDSHALINADFNLGDTKGQELIYDGGKQLVEDKYKTIKTLYHFDRTATINEGLVYYKDPQDYVIDNEIKQGDKSYFLYALIQLGGSPKIYEDIEGIPDPSVYVTDKLVRSNDAIRNTIIIPINSKNGDNDRNSIHILSKLQEGKVINILKIPYQLKLEDGFQILFSNAGKRFANRNSGNSTIADESLYDEEFKLVDKSGYLLYPFNAPTVGNKELLYEMFAYKEIVSFNTADVIKIPTSKLSTKEIMDKIIRTATRVEMKLAVDNTPNKLEIGMLNPNISPITAIFHETEVIIDIYNFYNRTEAEITELKGSYTINELGLETTIEISENQFAQWDENVIMSFSTDVGSTTLARQKYSMDAQKKGIDLQRDLAKNNIKLGQAGQYGGGVVGGFLSMLNPANWAAGGIRGQQNQIQNDIASNKKAQIDASVADASSTSPTVHTGNAHNLKNLNPQEYKKVFNWLMKYPNKHIANNIIKYLDKHGNQVNDWVKFDETMWKGRSRFNFLQIKDFLDYIGSMGAMDISIISEINDELLKGIRIWHEDTIDYDTANIETGILNNIPVNRK